MSTESESNTYTTTEEQFTKQPVFWQVVILMVLLIVIFSSAIVSEISDIANSKRPPSTAQTEGQAAAVITSGTDISSAFDDISINARAAYVFDMSTGEVLYEKNAEKKLPLASITKLMTALLAHEILSEHDSVVIDYNAILQDGDSGLLGGESFDRQTLSNLVLMTSSNDGAYALAEAAGEALSGEFDLEAFVNAMNIRATQLGFDALSFYNPTGLDLSETQAGAFGSAEDVAKLMAYIVAHYPNILTDTTERSARFYNEQGAYHNANNTNSTVGEISGLIGSKTGYTTLAGGNLVVAFNAGLNHPVVMVVLGSTRTGRFEDMLRLHSATVDSLMK